MSWGLIILFVLFFPFIRCRQAFVSQTGCVLPLEFPMFTIICTYWKISRLINIFRSNLLIALSVSSALSQELGSTSMLETLCTYNGPLTWTISSQFLNRNVSRDAYPEIRMRLNKLLDWTTWHKRIDNYLFVVKFFVIRESWYILYFKILF